ncbi:hypothetical protein LCGC14_2452400, partial [marine sediment metagenome]
MKTIDEIMRGSKEDFTYIGERLQAIREELVQKDTDNQLTTQFAKTKIAERFDMHPMTLN